jgi:hypothetical protein
VHLVDVEANMDGWPLAFCGLDRVIVVGRLYATTLSEGSAASSHRASSEGWRVQRESVPSGQEPEAP